MHLIGWETPANPLQSTMQSKLIPDSPCSPWTAVLSDRHDPVPDSKLFYTSLYVCQVGLFSSPHISSYRERFRINRQIINEVCRCALRSARGRSKLWFTVLRLYTICKTSRKCVQSKARPTLVPRGAIYSSLHDMEGCHLENCVQPPEKLGVLLSQRSLNLAASRSKLSAPLKMSLDCLA